MKNLKAIKETTRSKDAEIESLKERLNNLEKEQTTQKTHKKKNMNEKQSLIEDQA